MAADTDRIKRRLDALRGHRQLHEQTWRECFEYSLPELAAGLNGQHQTTAGEVQQQKARILDGTAGDSLDTMADGFMSGLTPANSLWFGLDIGDESHEERQWLDDASKLIWEKIHASNFDAEAHDALKFLGAGWFVLYCDEAKDRKGFYFECWPIAECFVASSQKGGRIDTVYREVKFTVAALVEEYGRAKVSQRSGQLYDAGKFDEMVDVVIAIEPRTGYVKGSRFAQQLPFASCHMELTEKHLLRESGYHEFPCMVPRWTRIPGTCYGFGPLSRALPDVKTLQEVKRWELAAAETAIAPPMVAEDDGVLNPRTVKLGPRKIIVANSVDSIKPLVTGARVDYAQMIVADIQAQVRRPLMADLFEKLLNDPSMTATQVHAIVGVIRQRMGPRFGRLLSEYLQALVERCYGIALRAGALGVPPESMRDADYTVRYTSPLARAQQLEEVSAMDRYEASLINEATAVPSLLDVYDWDEGARHKAKLLGVPLKLIPDARKVAKVREERQQAQQAAQQQATQQAVQAETQMATGQAMAQRMAEAA